MFHLREMSELSDPDERKKHDVSDDTHFVNFLYGVGEWYRPGVILHMKILSLYEFAEMSSY